MQYGNENVGVPSDPEAGVTGDGTVIALLKRIRTILLALVAASAFTFIGTRLATDSVVATSTAAAPTYGEGASVKLSTDLAGTLRTTAGGGGGNPSGGWLDSVRRVGRMDSLEVLDTTRWIVGAGFLDTLRGIRNDITRRLGRVVPTTATDTAFSGIVFTAGPPAGVTGNTHLTTVLMSPVTQVAASFVGNRLDVSLGSWLGSAAPTVGQKTMAASLPVAVASDQTGLPLFAATTVNIGSNDFITPPTNSVPVRLAPSEDFSGVYSFTIQDVAGVAAANNFACLFNLAASTDTAIVLMAELGSYSNIAAATNNSIVLFRVTTCTVGTLQATTAINEFTNGFTAATMEIRTANPTTTNAAAVFAWPVCHAITAAGVTGCGGIIYTPPYRLLLAPGEGVVFRQTVAGDTDQRYTFTIAWGERN